MSSSCTTGTLSRRTCASALITSQVAHLQAAPGLYRNRKGTDGRRHHRVSGGAAKLISYCGPADTRDHSVKLVKNCEYRLFQRPDDAVHPGFDKQTEQDMAQPDNFLANYEPLHGERLASLVEDVHTFYQFTPPDAGPAETDL